MTNRTSILRQRLAALGAFAALATFAACHGSITDSLLNENITTTPGGVPIINPSDVNSAAGADAVRLGALGRFRGATGGSESSWLFGGLLADEWVTSSTFIQNDEADERSITTTNGSVTAQFRTLGRVRTSSNQAIALMKKFLPTALSNTGELYLARGFGELQMGLDFCNGIPLSDGANPTPVFGQPLTIAQVFAISGASFDSALALETGTDAFTISVATAARIGKARTLMALNDYAGAAALVTGIPTTFSYDHTFEVTANGTSGDNILWQQPFSSQRYSVGDTTVTASGAKFTVKPAIPFASAKDPRLPVKNTGKTSQDGSVISQVTTLWDHGTSIPVFSGIDARLIEAENFLKKGDVTNWLATLNALRSAGNLRLGTVAVPVMPALADPGTDAARVDLLFYEKAFWTFSRGQRLGDMRRMIRQYGRDQATIFPSGTHYRGVPYGTDVNLPVPYNESVGNPNFKGCLDRKA